MNIRIKKLIQIIEGYNEQYEIPKFEITECFKKSGMIKYILNNLNMEVENGILLFTDRTYSADENEFVSVILNSSNSLLCFILKDIMDIDFNDDTIRIILRSKEFVEIKNLNK